MRVSPSRHWLAVLVLFVCGASISLVGCGEPEVDMSNSIINKTTQDIGEFKDDGQTKEADLQVKTSANPMAALGAYGSAVSTLSKQQIKRAVDLFNGLHGRYPKDHEEFMEEIIKKNNIKLPELPGKRRYQYDVENHELKVVEAE